MLIGEVAQQSGISARMLRHYDRIGLVRPSERTAGGYREYTEQDLRRLFHVEGLRSLGLSLHEIAHVLDDLSFSPVAMVDRLVASTRERLERDRELLTRLERVQGSDPGAWSDVLRTIGIMRQLGAADPATRFRFALTLAEPSGADASVLAEAALNEPEPGVANVLDLALARTGDAAVPVLAAALDDPAEQRRHRAVRALRKIGTPQTLEVLAAAADHSDPFVSKHATLASAALGRTDAVLALIRLIVEGDSDVEAADALGRLAARHGQADAVAEAIARELGRAEAPARQRLVAALGEIPGAAARATLEQLLDDPDPRVAHTAVFLLRPPDLNVNPLPPDSR